MTSRHEQMSAAMVRLCWQKIPGFEMCIKSESRYLRLLNMVVKWFNPRFMTDYVTTIYPNVYFPEYNNEDWKVLTHEFVHLTHAKKSKILFNLKYLFPQNLALLSLLSVFNTYHLLWLFFLAPLPAYFRMKEELDGYTMSMAINYWRYGSIKQEQIDWVRHQFLSSAYYFMWPFKKYITKKVTERAALIAAGHYTNKPIFKEVNRLIRRIWGR